MPSARYTVSPIPWIWPLPADIKNVCLHSATTLLVAVKWMDGRWWWLRSSAHCRATASRSLTRFPLNMATQRWPLKQWGMLHVFYKVIRGVFFGVSFSETTGCPSRLFTDTNTGPDWVFHSACKQPAGLPGTSRASILTAKYLNRFFCVLFSKPQALNRGLRLN